MRSRHLIGPRIGSTSQEVEGAKLRACAIPYDLLQEGSRRLGIMSLVGAALWTFGTLLYHFAGQLSGSTWDGTDVIALVNAILSLALFAYTRREAKNPQFILDLGLVYLVVTSIGLALIGHWHHMTPDWPVVPMISWIGAGDA